MIGLSHVKFLHQSDLFSRKFTTILRTAQFPSPRQRLPQSGISLQLQALRVPEVWVCHQCSRLPGSHRYLRGGYRSAGLPNQTAASRVSLPGCRKVLPFLVVVFSGNYYQVSMVRSAVNWLQTAPQAPLPFPKGKSSSSRNSLCFDLPLFPRCASFSWSI